MMLTVRLVFAVWLFCFTFADVFDDDNWRYVMQTMLDLMSFIVICQYHFYLFCGIYCYLSVSFLLILWHFFLLFYYRWSSLLCLLCIFCTIST